MYYGADYYPEHWPQERWATDARLMQQAGINVVRLAEFAWAKLEPQEGVYDFSWLDRALELLGKHGIRAVLGTPTAAPPAWVCQQYPEVMAVERDGRRVTFGMRRQYCPTSETYRGLSRRIVRVMAEHYANNPQVVGWQVDNELGGHLARCHCPACQRAFQEWARRRYGALDALNSAWGTAFWSHVYSFWGQIPLPWSTTPVSNPCLELDFWRFASDQWVSYQQEQVDILRALCPEHGITTNFMGFGFQDINYYDLARPLDFVSWDNYPVGTAADPAVAALSHATMRGLKDTPFWVMEQQAGPSGWQTVSRSPKPGQLRLWAYQSIAHGADAIVFFRWRTCQFNTEEYWHGILDHDGTPRRRYAEVRRMGQEVARLGDRLVGARSPKAVAMLLSYDDSFAFRLQPNAEGFSYPELFLGYYRAFHRLGIPVDVVSPSADLTPYRLVVAPTLHVLHEAWAENLRRYVAQGGNLVVGARSGAKNASNRVVNMPLPGLLRELCGIEVAEYDALGRSTTSTIQFAPGVCDEQPSCSVHTWCDIVEAGDAEVIAHYSTDYYAGQPAITARHVTGGTVVYVGVMGGDELCGALARWLARRVELRPLLSVPLGVEVAARETSGVTYLFVLNHTDGEQVIDLPYACTDLLADERYQGHCVLPAREVLILVAC